MDKRIGWSVFILGLGAWVRLSLSSIPYGYHDLGYLFSLERGAWGPKDLVHPLFLPVLALLNSAGWSEGMLRPLELLNLAAGALTLTMLFAAGGRLSGDWTVASLGSLMLGFSPGFWEGALRPDPYSLAAGFSAAAISLLAAKGRPRDALAGGAAGLAASFHLSALALLPLGGKRRAFFASFTAVLAMSFLLFALQHPSFLDGLRAVSFGELFGKIEQEPLSSLYTSRDAARQAADFFHTLWTQGGPVALLFAVSLPPAARERTGILAGLNLVFYSFFFLVNNSRNSFVYAALLPFPLLLPAAFRPRPLARAVLIPAAAALAAAAALRGLPWGPAGDPLLPEERYLESLLRRGDVLLLPGCPFPEVLYGRHFNILQAGESAVPASACIAPAAAGSRLALRIGDALGGGRRVFFPAPLPDERLPPGDLGGAQKRRGIFWTRSPLPVPVSAPFRRECRFLSPRGTLYCRFTGPRRKALSRWSFRVDRERLQRALERLGADDGVRERIAYLERWLGEAPGDPFAVEDLRAVLSEWLSQEAAAGAPRRPAPASDAEVSAAWRDLGGVFAALGRRPQASYCAARSGQG